MIEGNVLLREIMRFPRTGRILPPETSIKTFGDKAESRAFLINKPPGNH